MELKNSIKIERARHNYTQEKLAEKLGVSRQTVHAIEAGKFVPSTTLALKMAKLFEMKFEELFWLNEEK